MRRISAALSFVRSCVLFGALFVLAPHSAEAGTALQLGIDGLVERADLVLEARVVATRVLQTTAGRIETELTLHVARTFAGEALAERVVRIPGGVLPDGRGLVLAGMPRFALDEDVLVFFSSPGASGVRMPVGLSQGKLRVEHHARGAKSLARDEAGAALVDAHGASVGHAGNVELDYARTIASIEAAVAAKRARANAEKR